MFRLVKILNGRINQGEPMKLPATSGTEYVYGMALVLTESGTLAKCGEAVTPTHICCEDHTASGSDDRITVEPVSADMIFETTFSTAPAATGAKVKLAGDGLQVTSTASTTGGAVIFDKCGATKAGDKCLVQFK